MIVIAGPKNPLLDQEVALLKAYVAKGGSLVVMDDPTPFTNIGSNPDPLSAYLNSDWGISLDNDIIIDNFSNNALVAVATSLQCDESDHSTHHNFHHHASSAESDDQSNAASRADPDRINANCATVPAKCIMGRDGFLFFAKLQWSHL